MSFYDAFFISTERVIPNLRRLFFKLFMKASKIGLSAWTPSVLVSFPFHSHKSEYMASFSSYHKLKYQR